MNCGNLTIAASILSGNRSHAAGPGAALTQPGCGTATIVNSRIDGNTGGGVAGAIYNRGGTLTIVNSTITNNSTLADISLGNTGGIGNSDLGTLTIQNTILAGNAGGNCRTTSITSNGHNLSSDASCNLTGPGDLSSVDPLLGPLQDNGGPTETHALLPGSPAINAVPLANCTYYHDNNAATPPVPLDEDQRGVAAPREARAISGRMKTIPRLSSGGRV